MQGHFVIVNINCILSTTYNDVNVPCNVPHVWIFGPLGLCVSPGRQWTPKLCVSLVSELESFGYRLLQMERCTTRPLGPGIQVFENQHQTN